MKTSGELATVSKAAQKVRAESSKPKISGQSVVSASSVAAPARPMLPMANNYSYYCSYCGVSCNSQKQWDEHCVSEKHSFNVNTDKDHHWNHRPPPWSSSRQYELCEK